MFNRRTLVIAGAAALAFGGTATLSPFASAAATHVSAKSQTYDQKTFETAQAAGKTIVLHISAPWCPTCRAQAPILSAIEAAPKFKGLVVFNIDFDSRKDVLRGLRAHQQSTLIVFKGKTEVGRSTGDTNAASIEALVGKSI